MKVIPINKVIKEIEKEKNNEQFLKEFHRYYKIGLSEAIKIIKDNIKEVGFDESGEISFHTYNKIKLNDNPKTNTKK